MWSPRSRSRTGGSSTSDAASRRAGRRVVDLRGRTVVPGIIDNHNHIVLMGNRPGLPHAAGERVLDRRRAGDVRPPRAGTSRPAPGSRRSAAFTATTWCRVDQTPRLPTLAELDAAAPNNPVYISESFNGPSRDQQPRQEVLRGRLGRSRSGPTARSRAGSATRQPVGRRSRCVRRCSRSRQRKRGAVDAHRLRPRPRRHHAPRPGRVPGHQHVRATARRTRTTSRCTCRSSSLHEDGDLPARVRINFLHRTPTPDLPTLVERLRNHVPVLRRRHGRAPVASASSSPGDRADVRGGRSSGWPRPAGGPRSIR